MYSPTILTVVFLIATALDVLPNSVGAEHSHEKRGSPQLGWDITPDMARRLVSDRPFDAAFGNALRLILAALPPLGSDAVFAKYFNPDARQHVDGIFRRLLGAVDLANGCFRGNVALHNILVDLDTRPRSPKDDQRSELLSFESPNPQMLVRDDVFVYPDLDTAGTGENGQDNPCHTWEETGLTKDMKPLGHIILHEYVHWAWLLQGVNGADIEDKDDGYDIPDVRNLDRNLAPKNADSYAWWATENYWATVCYKPDGYDDLDHDKRVKMKQESAYAQFNVSTEAVDDHLV